MVAGGPAAAQPLLPRVPGQGLPTQYVQTHWTKQDGLPQSTVSTLLQTQSGYVWFGTQEGLVRFDGQRFTVFLSARNPGLPSNDITALLEDPGGVLWIGTTRGLTRYDGTRFVPVKALGEADVRALHYDGRSLWVGTLDGLARLDGEVIRRFTVEEGLPSPVVLAIGSDARSRLWVGTLAGGARLLDNRFVPARGLPEGEPNGEIRALHLTPQGRFVAGTKHGLSILHGDTFEPFAPPGAEACTGVSALTSDLSGKLWVGTLGEGLCTLMDGALYPLPTSQLPSGTVRALAPDAEGGLWVGFDVGGLLRLHRGPFLTFGKAEGLAAGSVLTVLEDRKGTLWVGTDGGGLNHIADGRITHYGKAAGLQDGQILSLMETRDGSIWAAPNGGGACRLEGTRFRCLTTQQGLASNYVFALHESADGTVWIGTDRGLDRLRNGRVESLSHLHPALDGHIVSSIQSHSGALWVGTYGGGIVRIAGETVQGFGTDEGLRRPEVLTLHADAAGILWAGLYKEGGLCRLIANDQRFHCYGSADGLLDDNVLQILSDDAGYLWVGSNQGIARVRLDGFGRYDAGAVPQLQVERVGVSTFSGLRDPEVNGGVQPTAWRGRGGTLYFATVAGVAVVTPGAVETYRNRRPPPVYIEEVRAGGERVLSEKMSLPPRQRDVRFVFSALSFQNPDSVRIRFRLDGHDDAWHDLDGHDRQYTYANLNAGTYTFRVQAANADGVWNEAGDSFTFSITPHPFETWWFYLLCGLAAVGAGMVLSRARVRHLQRRQQELEQVVEDRTAELRAHEAELKRVNEGLEQEVQRQLDVILEDRLHYEHQLIDARDKAEESARLKEAILNNMSHEIRTPISAILGFSEILSMEVKGDLHEFVHYIEENGKRLLNTLNSVLDMSRIESEGVVLRPESTDVAMTVRAAVDLLSPLALQKGLRLDVDLPTALPVVTDPFGVERVVTNLLSNAIKFTEHGGVSLSLRPEGDDFVLVVQDTGVGISATFLPHLFEPFKQESGGLARSYEGTGLGLALVHRYVMAMGGTIEVQSTKGQGTTFRVQVPRKPVLEQAVLVGSQAG